MKQNIWIFCLLILTGQAIAQDESSFTVEIGGSYNKFEMSSLNQHYFEAFAIPQGHFEAPINDGYSGQANIIFKTHAPIDFGPYLKHNQGNSTGSPAFRETDNQGNITNVYTGESSLKVSSTIVGLNANLHISDLLEFKESESSIFRNTTLTVGAGVGWAYSSLLSSIQYPTPAPNAESQILTSSDFQGQTTLKLEYPFLNRKFFGAIGIHAGYQYLQTSTLKDNSGNDWVVFGEHPISLDFSGVFTGLHLRFGLQNSTGYTSD
ncbi:hypothetical protein [Halocola ammonii]